MGFPIWLGDPIQLELQKRNLPKYSAEEQNQIKERISLEKEIYETKFSLTYIKDELLLKENYSILSALNLETLSTLAKLFENNLLIYHYIYEILGKKNQLQLEEEVTKHITAKIPKHFELSKEEKLKQVKELTEKYNSKKIERLLEKYDDAIRGKSNGNPTHLLQDLDFLGINLSSKQLTTVQTTYHEELKTELEQLGNRFLAGETSDTLKQAFLNLEEKFITSHFDDIGSYVNGWGYHIQSYYGRLYFVLDKIIFSSEPWNFSSFNLPSDNKTLDSLEKIFYSYKFFSKESMFYEDFSKNLQQKLLKPIPTEFDKNYVKTCLTKFCQRFYFKASQF